MSQGNKINNQFTTLVVEDNKAEGKPSPCPRGAVFRDEDYEDTFYLCVEDPAEGNRTFVELDKGEASGVFALRKNNKFKSEGIPGEFERTFTEAEVKEIFQEGVLRVPEQKVDYNKPMPGQGG